MAIDVYGSVLLGGSTWPHAVLILSTVQATPADFHNKGWLDPCYNFLSDMHLGALF